MDLALFQQFNPSFDDEIASAGTYELRLPAEKMTLFLEKKKDIIKESVQVLLESVKL